MATTWQFRRGTQAQNDAFTGAPGEITVDLTNRALRVHDGVTQGGWKIYTQGNTLDAEAVFFVNTDTSLSSVDVQGALEELDSAVTVLEVDTHDHANKALLDLITDVGSGEIITSAERTALGTAVQDGANIGGGAGQVYADTTTNTISLRSIAAGDNIIIDTDVTNPNAITISASATIGQTALLTTFDATSTEFASTNVQGALIETDSRLASLEGGGSVPLGGIVMWSGLISAIPTGWELCDGGPSVNGVVIPDLTDKFIVGAGSSYSVGSTGGTLTNTHTHQVIGTVSGHALTVAEMPAHSHGQNIYAQNGNGSHKQDSDDTSVIASKSMQDWRSGETYTWYKRNTYSAGSGAQHTHNVSITSGTNSNSDNRPPYYALAFIIYVGV